VWQGRWQGGARLTANLHGRHVGDVWRKQARRMQLGRQSRSLCTKAGK
jgi:hypothetical protein